MLRAIFADCQGGELCTCRDILARTAWGHTPSSPTLPDWQDASDGKPACAVCERIWHAVRNRRVREHTEPQRKAGVCESIRSYKREVCVRVHYAKSDLVRTGHSVCNNAKILAFSRRATPRNGLDRLVHRDIGKKIIPSFPVCVWWGSCVHAYFP